MNPPTKPSLQTCAELIRAAESITEQLRAMAAAARRGYTTAQLRAALASLLPKK